MVHLSGLMHTNDYVALKHIIQQLHMELLEEDKITGSFAGGSLFLSDIKGGGVAFIIF